MKRGMKSIANGSGPRYSAGKSPNMTGAKPSYSTGSGKSNQTNRSGDPKGASAFTMKAGSDAGKRKG